MPNIEGFTHKNNTLCNGFAKSIWLQWTQVQSEVRGAALNIKAASVKIGNREPIGKFSLLVSQLIQRKTSAKCSHWELIHPSPRNSVLGPTISSCFNYDSIIRQYVRWWVDVCTILSATQQKRTQHITACTKARITIRHRLLSSKQHQYYMFLAMTFLIKQILITYCSHSTSWLLPRSIPLTSCIWGREGVE